MVRKAELAAEQVWPARADAVRLPEDIVGPVKRLHALVPGATGAWCRDSSLEQGQEQLKLVPLRVVDGVSGRDRELRLQARGRPAYRVESAYRRVDRAGGERLLRPLHGNWLGVPRVGVVAVEELEASRRLHVGQLQVCDVREAEQRPAGALWPGNGGPGEAADKVRLTVGELDDAVAGCRPATDSGPGSEPAVRGERRAFREPSAHDCEPEATSTGSGRIVSLTRLPAGSADASAVGTWAITVVSPRSTVILLTAPRKVVAITVPSSGPPPAPSGESPGTPSLPAPLEATLTASGRTRATTGPAGTPGSTSGSPQPRTVTVPGLRTSPASRLVRPTNSATNEVAGRE